MEKFNEIKEIEKLDESLNNIKTVCQKCGQAIKVDKVTCPYCGYTQWIEHMIGVTVIALLSVGAYFLKFLGIFRYIIGGIGLLAIFFGTIYVLYKAIKTPKQKNRYILSAFMKLKENSKNVKAMNILIKSLNDDDPYYRIYAMDYLGEVGLPKIAKFLIERLKDNDERVRVKAAETLGKIKDSLAVEPLIFALKDKNWMVRKNAAWALGEILDTKGTKPLINSLKDDKKDVRISAADALEKIKDPNSAEFLVDFLDVKDNHLRKKIINILSKIGRQELLLSKTEYGDILKNEFNKFLDDEGYEISFDNWEELREVNKPAFDISTRKKAIKELTKLKEKQPNCAHIYTSLAQALWLEEDYKSAEDILMEGLTKVFRKSSIADSLGYLHLWYSNSLDDSVQWYSRAWIAQRNVPKIWSTHLYLGFMYKYFGNNKVYKQLHETANNIYGWEGVSLNEEGKEKIKSLIKKQKNDLIKFFLNSLASKMISFQSERRKKALEKGILRRKNLLPESPVCFRCSKDLVKSSSAFFGDEKPEDDEYLFDGELCIDCATIICRKCYDRGMSRICPRCGSVLKNCYRGFLKEIKI